MAAASLTGRREAAVSLSATWVTAADHNGSVVDAVEQIVVERAVAVDPLWILHAYLDDVGSRYHGRPVTDDEMTVALRESSDDLIKPDGLLLVARVDGRPSGCVGLRLA